MLELKTNIVFESLSELQEAVDLGLKYKDRWLNGTYTFPTLQLNTDNCSNYSIEALWKDPTLSTHNKEIIAGLKTSKLWSEVRNQYINPVEELTLAEVCRLLGKEIKIVKE